ncbi:MAG: fused MFS/spermidine synthase [Opitutus sp.]
MKGFQIFLLSLGMAIGAGAASTGNSVETFDTLYNSLTVEKRGTVVELRARSRSTVYIESAVDLADPMRLVVPYTKTLYAGLFFVPNPQRVLMIGLGGAAFHRPFVDAFPDALLQTVELDAKVFELCRSHLAFKPTAKTPVAVSDGRLFVKRDKTKWDWLILDAFRGGFVPPHLKTQEFYRECAARLNERGVFITNLHPNSKLYESDLKTLRETFPQVVLFQTPVRSNVIACAVNYKSPVITAPATWAPAEELTTRLKGRVDLAEVKTWRVDFPALEKDAQVLTDDFAPVEFLDAMKTNNTGSR